MLEYITDMKVKEVLADLNHLYDDNELDVDGTILIRFSDHIKELLEQVKLRLVKKIISQLQSMEIKVVLDGSRKIQLFISLNTINLYRF